MKNEKMFCVKFINKNLQGDYFIESNHISDLMRKIDGHVADSVKLEIVLTDPREANVILKDMVRFGDLISVMQKCVNYKGDSNKGNEDKYFLASVRKPNRSDEKMILVKAVDSSYAAEKVKKNFGEDRYIIIFETIE